jgi:hypothetical protein
VGGRRHKERLKEGEDGGNIFVFMYENRTTKPVEIVLRIREGERGRGESN